VSVGGGLPAIAGWDVPQLRGAAGTLVLLSERLVPWRFRLDTVGRRLATAECWSGPAGSAAAAALLEVSTVSSGVQDALEESARLLQVLVAAADEAQELAAAALAVAAAGGVGLDDAGDPLRDLGLVDPAPTAQQRVGRAAVALYPPADGADAVAPAEPVGAADRAGALADEAHAAAARALSAAVLAGEPLGRLGSGQAPGASGFPDIAARLAPPGLVPPPPVPAPAVPPGQAAAWWAALTGAQQRAAVLAAPAAVGALDGLPAWARDRANRLELDRALAELPPGGAGHRTATAVAAEIDRQEAAGQSVQLLQFQPDDALVSLALGDLDTAEAVAVLVPGILTSPDDDLPGLTDDAARVAAAAGAAAPGLAVATVAWLGYRPPATVLAAPSSQLAQRGGPALDRALDGFAAARAAPGSPAPPRTTVLAHSYGTLLASRAAQAPGRLATDALVLLGSPGTEALTARDLEAAEVHGAWTPGDPVSWVGWFGRGPVDPWFGDTPLPTETTQGHTQYYDPDRPTLAAVGEVVAGRRGPS
jgi:alpha/beta hydrolase family protein